MHKKSDLTLVLMVILLLGASIGILYARKVLADQLAVSNKDLIVLENQDSIDYLQPYLIAGGMDGAAAALSQFAPSVQRNVLNALIGGTAAALTEEQKIELLGALLVHSPTKQTQDMVMPMFYINFVKIPLFSWLMPTYEKAITAIVSYDEQVGKKRYAKQLSRWINSSAINAVTRDEPELMASLIAANIRPDKRQVNKLLAKVVTEGRSVAFIPLLIDQLAGDANYSPDRKRTLLIMAVEKNNIAVVKALLAQGADPEKVVDRGIGNARQVAFERGYAAIEQLLQKKSKK